MLCWIFIFVGICVSGCKLPEPVSTIERFSLVVWSNQTNGHVFTSEQLNVTVTSNKQITVTTPITSLSFPSFDASLFPGSIVVSFFRYNWAVYSIHSSCNGYSIPKIVTYTHPVFLFESPDAIVHVPSSVPDLTWFEPCEEITLYSVDGVFQTPYFPLKPTYLTTQEWLNASYVRLSKTKFNVPSMCVYSSYYGVNLIVGASHGEVQAGGTITLNITDEGDVHGTYGTATRISDDAYNYTTNVTYAFTGKDYLYFNRSLVILAIVPAVLPIASTIWTNEPNYTVVVDEYIKRTPVVSAYQYFYRVNDGDMIFPEENTEITLNDTLNVLSVYTCDYIENATILLRQPTPLTIQGVHSSQSSFSLMDYLIFDGNPGLVPVHVTLFISHGNFLNSVCQRCTRFDLNETLDEIEAVFSETIVTLDSPIGDYSGIRIQVNDNPVTYIRFIQSLTTVSPTTSVIIDTYQQTTLWIRIVTYSGFALFVVSALIYIASEVYLRELKKRSYGLRRVQRKPTSHVLQGMPSGASRMPHV